MTGTPRSQVAARKPAASPSAPPPIATSGSPRSARSRASSRAAASMTASRFAASPCGQHDPLDRRTRPPRARPPSASPAAAHAPGSETRIARPTSARRSARRDLGRRDPLAEDEIGPRRCPPRSRTVASSAAAPCRRELVDAFDDGPRPRRRRSAARPPRRSAPGRGPAPGSSRSDRGPATSGRTFGLRRSRWARTSGRTSSQIGRRRRYSAQRLRGSMTAPPPVAIDPPDRRLRVGPPEADRPPARSRARNAASPSSAKICGIRRPSAFSIDSSRSTNSAPWRWASRRPTAVLPLPGSPTRTTSTSVDHVSRRRRSRTRPRPTRRSPAAAAVAGRRPRSEPGTGRGCPRVSAIESPPNLSSIAVGEDEHHHRLADDAGGRDDADVGPLVVGLVDGLAGQQVGRRAAAGRASRSA